MMKYRLALVFALASSLVGTTGAMAASVYLYDASSEMAKIFNDVVVWTDPAATRNSTALTTKTIQKMVCAVKPGSKAMILSDAGSAVEVKISGSCKGFVRKNLVHANK